MYHESQRAERDELSDALREHPRRAAEQTKIVNNNTYAGALHPLIHQVSLSICHDFLVKIAPSAKFDLGV